MNWLRAESSGTDIQQTLRASVHSRLGSVVTTSDADGGKPSRRKMVRSDYMIFVFHHRGRTYFCLTWILSLFLVLNGISILSHA